MRTTFTLTLLAALFLAPLAQAGAWTQPRGELWVKVSGFTQRSDEFFAREGAVLPDGTVVEPGDARPFDDHGRSQVRQLWFEVEWGATERLSLGVQAPWKWLDFDDDVLALRSFGWGDVRTIARYGLLTGQTRLSVRTAIKWPTGRFTTRQDRLPIGENQADVEFGIQVGHPLGRPLSWLGAEAGRRLRLEDTEFDFDPDDEWFWLLEAGHTLHPSGKLGLKALWQGVRGSNTSLNFLAPGTALGRDFDQLDVMVMIDLGAVFVETGIGFTLGSETFPTAPIWSLGLSRSMTVGSLR